MRIRVSAWTRVPPDDADDAYREDDSYGQRGIDDRHLSSSANNERAGTAERRKRPRRIRPREPCSSTTTRKPKPTRDIDHVTAAQTDYDGGHARITDTQLGLPILDRVGVRRTSPIRALSRGGRSAQVSITEVSASPDGKRAPIPASVRFDGRGSTEFDGNCGHETRSFDGDDANHCYCCERRQCGRLYAFTDDFARRFVFGETEGEQSEFVPEDRLPMGRDTVARH